MTDLIVIGAGTAGLTAAIYGTRAGLSVKIIEKAFHGGQVVATGAIENYPGMPGVSGADFAMVMHKQAKDLGAQVLYAEVQSARLSGDAKQIVTPKGSHQAKSVIIATGAAPRKLGVPGEEQWLGRGVAFCATCDGMLYKGKDVAVVGGGNAAMQNALFLSEICGSVTVVHRSAQFRAEQKIFEQVKARGNVKFITDAEVTEVAGESALAQISVADRHTGQISALRVDGVFVAIGLKPDNLVFSGEISLDEAGYIIAGEDCRTNLPGVFAAGDTRTKQVRQIVTAAADGCVAALAAKKYIQGESIYDKFNEEQF